MPQNVLFFRRYPNTAVSNKSFFFYKLVTKFLATGSILDKQKIKNGIMWLKKNGKSRYWFRSRFENVSTRSSMRDVKMGRIYSNNVV